MKVKSESEITQSCPTLSDPMDCSLPGSSVHGIFQARVLEWGAVAFSGINSRSDLSSSVDPTQADTKLNDLNIKSVHGGQIPSVYFSFSTLSLLINLVPSKQFFFFFQKIFM